MLLIFAILLPNYHDINSLKIDFFIKNCFNIFMNTNKIKLHFKVILFLRIVRQKSSYTRTNNEAEKLNNNLEI